MSLEDSHQSRNEKLHKQFFLSERDCKFSQLRRQSLIQFTIHAYNYGEQEHKKWVDEQNSIIFLF
jgi:hypothetical protein